MTKYIYHRSVVEYRTPFEDGIPGQPEVVKRYIQEIKGKSTAYVRTPSEANKAKKAAKKDADKDKFKTKKREIKYE
jgi:hypothetical protein